MRKARCWGLILVAILGHTVIASERLELARETLQEWVEVEKTISLEAQAWREKEASLLDLIAVWEKEAALLHDQLETTGNELSETDRQRAELLGREVAIGELHASVVDFLVRAEAEVAGLKASLPEPLLRKLEPFYRRLPGKPTQTTLGIAERMQTLVGILAEIHKFDGQVSLSRELRTLPDGRTGEVQTLYLGLGVAYYLAPGGIDAGVGEPTTEGWKWKSLPELADRVEEAIAIHEGTQQEARFLALPVRMGGGE